MDRDLQRRALDGFDEASTIAPPDRETWISETYSSDPALREAIMGLFAASRRSALMPTELPDADLIPEALAMSDRIGAYRPVALIGTGGMGRVYRAERADGHFEQTVAIKMISARLFSGSVSEQFRIERQILARLRHPHIARLLDGGVTEAGLSYIVMEVIDGLPIMDHADALGLDVRQRLGLFRDVCSAVQYAHQQLVVHADIKPSNILVDADGCAKLLDFGIGAMLGEAAAGRSDGVGGARTPEWASPQLMAGERPTPPDDIFALGLLLRALVGDRLSAEADLGGIAACATADDPGDRYASADALSADVGRWLDGMPVAARPTDRLHRASLFWRRNRLAVIVSGMIGVGLVVALLAMSLLYWSAERARQQAQQRFDEVRALSRFMLGDVTDALEETPGTSKLRHAIALRGRTYLEQLSRIPGAPADLRLETAIGYSKTGTILARNSDANAGDPVAGRIDLIRADRELTGLLADFPSRQDIRLALARTLIAEATVAAASFNDEAGALRTLDRTDGLLRGIPGASRNRAEAGWVGWEAGNARATILDGEGRFAEMVPLMNAALRDGRALGIPANHVLDRPLYEGASLHLLGDAEYYLNHPEQALLLYEQATALTEAARSRHADAKLFDRSAYYHYEVASTLSAAGRSAQALPWIDRGAAIVDALGTFDDSPRTRHVDNIVTLQRAEILGELHRYGKAIALMRANVSARERLAAAEPDNYEDRRAVPVALRPLASLYFDAHRMEEGCRTLAEARALWARLAASGGLTGYDQGDEMHDLAKLARRCPAPRDKTH